MENCQDTPPTPDSPKSELVALSPRKLAAQRANATKSTGPRSIEGMAVARLNALKHGFFARDVVNSELDGPARAEEFNSLLDALLEEFQPESARERILIDEVAASCWRIRRILRYECRESWIDEEAARRANDTESPSDALLASMGYDKRPARRRTDRKLRRSGLDAFILPSDRDVNKIVRFERTVKRNLFRALDSLERIRVGRTRPQSSDPTSSPAIMTQHQAIRASDEIVFDGTNPPIELVRPKTTTGGINWYFRLKSIIPNWRRSSG